MPDTSTSIPAVSAAGDTRSTHLHHSCCHHARRHASCHRNALDCHIHQLLLLLLLDCNCHA
jgi:hypothetical protein